MLLWFLVSISWQFFRINADLYLYDIDEFSSQTRLKHTCLQYLIQQNTGLDFVTEYCLRPSQLDSNSWLEVVPASEHRKFTFEELRAMNLTGEELIKWSPSADLIEDYQSYLNDQDRTLASKEILRCVKPWFGSRCQYLFTTGRRGNFVNFVNQHIKSKVSSMSQAIESFSTCYTLLSCANEGVPVCLDWTQVCDGRIDCIDGEEDETLCFELEINECKSNEYRCHNGLCIPKDFVSDSTNECIDQSDLMTTPTCELVRLQVVNYVWNERTNRPNGESRVCGHAKCLKDFRHCQNAGYDYLVAPIATQGTLPLYCWIAMVCLTKIMHEANGVSCEQWIRSAPIFEHLSTCDLLIVFPSKPILLHHLRFLYQRDELIATNTSQAAVPTYICYDSHLCEHLQPTFQYQNLTCRHASLMALNQSSAHLTWVSIIDAVRPLLSGCMLPSQKRNQIQHRSLYCCRNSSKCISQHRIIDGIIDCPYHDDEQAVELSCSIPNSYRFRCPDQKPCQSPLLSKAECPVQHYRDLKDLLFQDICNGIRQTVLYLLDGQNHTDETECHAWECSNIYTRCDQFWNCPDGADERNCTFSSVPGVRFCPGETLECVSIVNYTVMCLSRSRVGDGIVDCLGGADEKWICRDHIRQYSTYPGYLCRDTSTCLFVYQLCDGHLDCKYGEDEVFCDGRRDICHPHFNPHPTDADRLLCRLAAGYWRYFSFDTLPTLPSLVSNQTFHGTSLTRHSHPVSNAIQINTAIDSTHSWYCHYGLNAILRINSTLNLSRCFCPPDFYGNRCEYQNQRVSITLKVYPVERHGIQSFLITLLSEDDPYSDELIHSYHQTSYVLGSSCGKTFKFFLLFSTRPKNLSSHYFIKIDAFNQTDLTYLGSWRSRIPFTFLPVNPVSIAIRVPAGPRIPSTQCRLHCQHGRCLKYLNEETFFCQCNTGWIGKRCDQAVPFNDCASDSVWAGVHENRSICVCPINRFGRRCLLKYPCPEDLCENDGRCVITDATRTDDSYACLCSEKFHGTVCQGAKSVLSVSFKDMSIPPYVLLTIFYSNHYDVGLGKPLMRMIGKKLRMFQNSVVFYVDGTFQIAILQTHRKNYLAVLDQSVTIKNISTILSPKQECPSFRDIADRHLAKLPLIRRVKYFHQLCRQRLQLMCFTDAFYFCFCTVERHANCLPFEPNFTCPENVHCQNGAECFQDRPDCPLTTFCACRNCFYGDRCQFYAKGIGLTLDDIFRYELRTRRSLGQESLPVKTSAVLAVVMLLAGFINSGLSLMVFCSDASRQVGASIYLFASSITSLLSVTMLNAKFWFLIIAQTRLSISRAALSGGCSALEPTLKLCLYMDHWLNACVAIERALTVHKGVRFDKKASKSVAKRVIISLPILVGTSLMHEFLYRRLSDDEEEQRVWCVLQYSKPLVSYHTFILSFHTLVTFMANLISGVFIIVHSAQRKKQCQEKRTYKEQLQKQFQEHGHLIISPMLLVILDLPRVVISLLPGCVKVDRNAWLYLSAYFISYVPTATVFFIFVLPSPLYRQEFTNSGRRLKRRISRMIGFS